jgi:hypothetical protein
VWYLPSGITINHRDRPSLRRERLHCDIGGRLGISQHNDVLALRLVIIQILRGMNDSTTSRFEFFASRQIEKFRATEPSVP